MKLVADLDKISSNLTNLDSEIDTYSSAVSTFSSASINCTVEEVSGDLESFKSAIAEDLNKLNTSSTEYNQLVEECCTEYKANEDNTSTINMDNIVDIISNNRDVTIEYQGNASTKLTTIPAFEVSNITSNLPYDGKVNDLMQSVATTAANNSGGGYDNLCEAWAENQWANATGIAAESQPSAYDAWLSYGVSTSKDNIPVGAMVYGSGSPTVDDYNNPYGHVGVYVGDGMVADQGGTVSLDSWISWQHANCDGHEGWIGWGWQNNMDLTKS